MNAVAGIRRFRLFFGKNISTEFVKETPELTVYVDHDARREKIAEAAFDLFAQKGYDGVTYGKIADRCGLSRTAIYKYFPDKEKIFLFAIRRATEKMSTTIGRIVDRTDLSWEEKIRRVLHFTLKLLSENRIFLTVVLDYLISQKMAGANIRRRVRRHTFGMRFLLERLLDAGKESEEFRPIRSVSGAASLYSLLESYVLNLTVIEAIDWKDSLALIDSMIDDLKIRTEERTAEDRIKSLSTENIAEKIF